MKPFYILILLLLVPFINTTGQVTNYNLQQNWMCHPMKTDDVSRMPMNIYYQGPNLAIDSIVQFSQPTNNTGIDIFYIYPTLDLSIVPGNTAISAIDTNYAKYVFRMQAGLTAKFGRVFAPYYRQATYGTFVFANQQNQAKFLDTAFNDIKAAFNHYLANHNNGNKIILIGHSQGAYLVQAILRQYFDNNPTMLSKLVVAIPGGVFFYTSQSSHTGGGLQNIKICPPKSQGYECGCIIPWRSFKHNSSIPAPANFSPFMNPLLVANNFFYSIFDSTQHEVKYYDFGYAQYDTLTSYIMLNPADSIDYFAWKNMCAAKLEQPSISRAGLMIDDIRQPSDLRTYPMTGTNYHVYDFRIVQADMISAISNIITSCANVSVNNYENLTSSINIFPNPFNENTIIQTNFELKNFNITLLNYFGQKVREIKNIDGRAYFFTRDNLPGGLYFVQLTKDNQLITSKKIIIID